MKNLKLRLIVMNFLEFAVWGAYLTCMGNYLGTAGMGTEISWFYAIQGIVSIFMPTLMGIVADKYIQPQRLLGICHLIAGMAMIALAYMGMTNPTPDKTAFIAIYTLSVAFYMFSKFAGILSAALSQHHLLEFEIGQLEFHHLH